MTLTKEMVLSNLINRAVIQYLGESDSEKGLEFCYDLPNLKEKNRELKTHPDIIDLLWIDYSKMLPLKCQAILFGIPALINPINGVIFGVAEGTNPPLLRFASHQIPEIISKGGKIKLFNLDGIYADASVLGEDWIYCFSFIKGMNKYCLQAYYNSINLLERDSDR